MGESGNEAPSKISSGEPDDSVDSSEGLNSGDNEERNVELEGDSVEVENLTGDTQESGGSDLNDTQHEAEIRAEELRASLAEAEEKQNKEQTGNPEGKLPRQSEKVSHVEKPEKVNPLRRWWDGVTGTTRRQEAEAARVAEAKELELVGARQSLRNLGEELRETWKEAGKINNVRDVIKQLNDEADVLERTGNRRESDDNVGYTLYTDRKRLTDMNRRLMEATSLDAISFEMLIEGSTNKLTDPGDAEGIKGKILEEFVRSSIISKGLTTMELKALESGKEKMTFSNYYQFQGEPVLEQAASSIDALIEDVATKIGVELGVKSGTQVTYNSKEFDIWGRTELAEGSEAVIVSQGVNDSQGRFEAIKPVVMSREELDEWTQSKVNRVMN